MTLQVRLALAGLGPFATSNYKGRSPLFTEEIWQIILKFVGPVPPLFLQELVFAQIPAPPYPFLPRPDGPGLDLETE